MYSDITSITAAVEPLVGFAPNAAITTAQNTTSTTGLQFNDVHALLQDYNNFRAVFPQTASIDAVLANIKAQAARTLVSSVLSAKISNYKTKSVFEDLNIYEGAANVRDAIVKHDRFVGWEINLRNFKDLVATISKIGLQFTQPQAALTLYVYHTSQPAAPIETIQVAVDGGGSFAWVDANILMKHVNANTNAGGSYIIGYKESELTGQALNRDRDISIKPCATCSTYEVRSWTNWSQFVKIHPFSVAESEIGLAGALWDLNKNDYDYQKNWGINFNITVKCDVTETVKKHATVFKRAYQLQVATMLLEAMLNTMENNDMARKLQKLAQYALDEKENPCGVRKELREAVKAVDFDLSSLNSVCFPHDDKRRIRNGAA